MNRTTRRERVLSMQKYSAQHLSRKKLPILPLNVQLASNPFLKNEENYHFLIYKLNDYNRRVLAQDLNDQYEAMVYERLHSAVCDLAYIERKEDMLTRLEETRLWFKQQDRIVVQRKNQGDIRYQVTKSTRNPIQAKQKEINFSQRTEKEELPSKKFARDVEAFRRGHRTRHRDLDAPSARLNEYKRKILNLSSLIEVKHEKKQPKILYPKIPRFQPKEDEPEEEIRPQEGQIEGGQALDIGPDGQAINVQPANEEKEGDQQDLGGLGEEPGQPEEEQPPEEDEVDKLAPKRKGYTLEYNQISRKGNKGSYQFYRGQEHQAERRMEEKYLKIQQNTLQKQKQDNYLIENLDEWGTRKGKQEKQWQKCMQTKLFRPNYTFSFEKVEEGEKIPKQDEIKFNLTQNLVPKPKFSQFNLINRTLPARNNENKELEQKEFRKDRFNTLKNRFSKLLNLKDFQKRESGGSICQYTSRKRGLSEIIKNNSASKERILQLDQVTRIKQKLARSKAGVDVRSLSMGLVGPEREEDLESFVVPGKDLPSNPFMVDTKKKKKKKKK